VIEILTSNTYSMTMTLLHDTTDADF
jgi:hypothetical protein